MSERPEAEIEDVLSSIRRLVAGDQSVPAAGLSLVKDSTGPRDTVAQEHAAAKEAAATAPADTGAFVLTQENRVPPSSDAPVAPLDEGVALRTSPRDEVPEIEAEVGAAPLEAQDVSPEPEAVAPVDPAEITHPSMAEVEPAPEAEPEEPTPVFAPREATEAPKEQPRIEEVAEAPMIELGESDTVPHQSATVETLEEDWPLDMSSPAARAAMTARLGAMRQQWESDAAAESEKAAHPQPPSPPEPIAPVPKTADREGPKEVPRPDPAPLLVAEAEPKEPEGGASEMERRPVWSRVQPAIEKAVRDSLEPVVKDKLTADINDMLVDPEAEATTVEPKAQTPSEPPVFARAAPREPRDPEPATAMPPMRAHSHTVESPADPDFPENLFGPETGLESAEVRAVVVKIVHEELQGALGERITRNVRKLVRREIQRALSSREFD